MLNDESHIDLIEASFERVKLRKAEFSGAFYARLFTNYPELQPLFAHTDTAKQGSKLYAALVLLVENLRHPVELERVLLPLGEKHIGYGATPEAFPKVGNTIVATLQEFLGDDWTPELHQAWTGTLDTVTHTMLRGAGMAMPERPAVRHQVEASPQSTAEADNVAKLVQDSFAVIKGKQEAFTVEFYRELFERSPHLQPLFENVDTRKQGAKLHAALVLLVENLRRPSELERVLLPLGRKHVAYGATEESYPLVGDALMATLETFLGDAWTGPVAAAWSQTLESVLALMIQGGKLEAEAANTSPAVEKPGKRVLAEPTPQSEAKRRKARPYSRRRSIAARFAQWFYSAPLSTIVGVWFLIGAGLVSLSFLFPSIRGVVVFANPLSLLLALFLYIRETPERKKQFHYHAWSTIDHAAHVRVSNARFLALQDLCADGVSLKGLTLEGADLKGIDLAEADISAAALEQCNLSGALMNGADLNSADLREANLSGAQLSGANLGFAKLNNANCSSADLSGANLMFADLSSANLSGANLTGAKLSGTLFNGTYLSGANLLGTDIDVADLGDAFLVGAVMPDGSIGS